MQVVPTAVIQVPVEAIVVADAPVMSLDMDCLIYVLKAEQIINGKMWWTKAVMAQPAAAGGVLLNIFQILEPSLDPVFAAQIIIAFKAVQPAVKLLYTEIA